MSRRGFVPALGVRGLGALYDPLVRHWGAARRLRGAVIDALAVEPGHRVLDLGCGPGRLAVALAERHPAAQIEALDVDPTMVARARRRATRARVAVTVHERDMAAPPALGSFHRLCSTMTFHHLSPAAKIAALAAARALLVPGGRLVVADFGPPLGATQRWLFTAIQQPLDGFANTEPHRDGRFAAWLHDAFPTAEVAARWRTAAGTIELFVATA